MSDMDTAIAEQIRDFKVSQVQNADEVTLFSPGDSEVSGALATNGGRMQITKTQADRVTVYDKQGVSSDILVYMLSKKLQQGFTLQPTVQRIVGDLKCFLHPESEDRAEADAAGLRGRECRKANLMSEWDRELHMERKHKTEWRTISRMREQQAQDEQRNWQRIQAEAMERLAAAGGGTTRQKGQ